MADQEHGGEALIPTLMKHGKEIGKAAQAGDEAAKEIIHWYSTSQRIGDMFGVTLAEEKAKAWIANRST